MKSEYYLYKLFTIFLIVSLLLSTTGCSTITIMTNWKELPKDRSILVTTNSGEQYKLENWRFDKDGSIVGWAKSLPLTIPYYNIGTIATIDETNVKIAKTTFIVAGSVCSIALFIYIIKEVRTPFEGWH